MRGDVIRTKRQGFIRVSSSPRLGIFAVLRHDIDQLVWSSGLADLPAAGS